MINLKFILEKNYYIKIIALFLFWKVIKNHPNLLKYKRETVFSVYRSLFCMYFMLYSLENLICNFEDIFTDPFIERPCYNDIIEWFIVYLLFDLINMVIQKNKRIDLYIHHIWCLGTILIAKGYNSAHSVVNLTLIAEAISIVSGIDLMAMEDNNMKESYYYKLYRKNIIRYLRLPLWIVLLLVGIRHTNKFPKVLWYNCIMTSILMIGLDQYWEKKCDKVIKKYKNDN